MKIKLWCICLVILSGIVIFAQDEVVLPAIGDVPLANRIQVLPDADDPTTMVIQGDVGAVFPNAFIAVRNRYTGDQQITSAASNGEFSTRLYGREQTPFWIASFERFPSDDDINNALGTILYSEGDDSSFYIESALGGNVPSYRIWGEVDNTQLAGDDNLSVSLTVELDITDDFPVLDGLVFQLELEARDYNANVLETVTVTLSDRQTIPEENLLTLTGDILFASSFNNDALLYFSGYVGVADGELEPWNQSSVFGLLGQPSTDNVLHLPIVIRGMGQQDIAWQLGLTLDSPSADDQFIRTDTFTLLSPRGYSIEPKLAFVPTTIARQPLMGEVQAQITRPSGQLEILNAEILQGQARFTDPNIILATDNPAMTSYAFDDYGDYQVVVDVTVRVNDVDYSFFQSYFIRIAETLSISPAMLWGTPLQVEDSLLRSGYLVPPVPAFVQINLSNNNDAQDRNLLTVQADLYGYFSTEALLMDAPNAYQMSYVAIYEDAEGRLWSSLELTRDVFVSSGQLANGRRGLSGYDGQQQAWFDTTVFPDDDRNAGRQPYFPFYAGDVAYVPDADDGGIAAAISTIVRDEVLEGAIYVVSPNGLLLQSDEIINGDLSITGDDTFNQGLGMGVDGLREGDYALLFGALAIDDDYAMYGASMLVQDEDDPARVLSPFLDGLTIFGQSTELIFVPTGMRPAQVLTLGDTFALVGQVVPTVPADIRVLITSPSGRQIEFNDVVNAVGYFSKSEHEFELDEIGRWIVDINTSYRGETSAGQLERPYPQGDLQYDVYVVPADNPTLGEAEFATDTRQVTQTFPMTIPEGWSDVRAFATVTTPSWILVQDELTVFPSGTSYTYNPTQLARDYPNVELLDNADGDHVADVVTLTLAMTGIDETGEPVIQTRQYTITHDTTYSYNEAMLR